MHDDVSRYNAYIAPEWLEKQESRAFLQISQITIWLSNWTLASNNCITVALPHNMQNLKWEAC